MGPAVARSQPTPCGALRLGWPSESARVGTRGQGFVPPCWPVILSVGSGPRKGVSAKAVPCEGWWLRAVSQQPSLRLG